MTLARRTLAALTWLLAAALFACALQRAWTAAGCVACMPSYDVADYLNRALDLREADGLGATLSAFLRPDVHPPGHPAVLALGMSLVGLGLQPAMLLSLGLFALALALMPWLGHQVDPERGRWAGLLAAGLTAVSVEHVRLAAAPMTENLALCLTLLTLGLGARSLRAPRPVLALAVGLSLLAGALVRYSLGPMLLAPLLGAWLLERLAARGGWLDPRPALWAAPVAVFFGAWLLLEPGLALAISRFTQNVDSGLPTWSVENLLWAPRTFAAHYAPHPALAVATGGLALLGLAQAWRPARFSERGADRLVQLFALMGLAAITLHPFKLTRVLHGTLPLLTLWASLALLRAPLPKAPAPRLALSGLAAALGLGLTLSLLRGPAIPEGGERLETVDNPAAAEVIEDIMAAAAPHRRVVMLGASSGISDHLIRLHLRMKRPGVEVVIERPVPPMCAETSTTDPDPRCALVNAEPLLADPAELAATLWVVLTPRPNVDQSQRRRRQGRARSGTLVPRDAPRSWGHYVMDRFAVLAEDSGLSLVSELVVEGARGPTGGLRIYEASEPRP